MVRDSSPSIVSSRARGSRCTANATARVCAQDTAPSWQKAMRSDGRRRRTSQAVSSIRRSEEVRRPAIASHCSNATPVVCSATS